jgi:hypothetical protein
VKACELGIRLKRRDPKYKSEVRFPVSPDVWAIRLKHANRRGLSVAQFVRLFVEVAVDERLIYKILDEDRPRSRKPRPAGAPLMGRPRKMKEAAVAAS